MKKQIPALLVVALCAVSCLAQSPAPTPAVTPAPAPFDALGIAPTPTPAPGSPAPTPVPPDAAHVAHAQGQFYNQTVVGLKADNAALSQIYQRSLARFTSDDPAKVPVPLTAAQKVATLSAAQLTEVLTLAWELYDILAPLNPGLAQPAIARPSGS